MSMSFALDWLFGLMKSKYIQTYTVANDFRQLGLKLPPINSENDKFNGPRHEIKAG